MHTCTLYLAACSFQHLCILHRFFDVLKYTDLACDWNWQFSVQQADCTERKEHYLKMWQITWHCMCLPVTTTDTKMICTNTDFWVKNRLCLQILWWQLLSQQFHTWSTSDNKIRQTIWTYNTQRCTRLSVRYNLYQIVKQQQRAQTVVWACKWHIMQL